jgi:chromosome segregation ATPase
MSRRTLPDFDLALRGYHRRQVERCVHDLSARLEAALSQLDAVEVLQAKLSEAEVEIEQLRHELASRDAADPPYAARLAKIMEEAERLRVKAGTAERRRPWRRTRVG